MNTQTNQVQDIFKKYSHIFKDNLNSSYVYKSPKKEVVVFSKNKLLNKT